MEPIATPNVTGHTKTVCLIGTPVSHSMSPAMHNASFAKLGVDCIYTAYDISTEDLPCVVEAFERLGVVGYSVTMPCKTAILPYMAELSPAAKLMGAVNVVSVKDGVSYGHNTDGLGFVENLREYGFDPKGKRCTIVGTGGAGSAIITQLALDGMTHIDAFNRNPQRHEELFDKFATITKETGCQIEINALSDDETLRNCCAEADLFVNATKVGMIPNEDTCVIDETYLHEGMYVADTVYEPRTTKLLQLAEAKGLKTVPGLGMLLQQAAAAERIWLDIDMPIDYIKEILH